MGAQISGKTHVSKYILVCLWKVVMMENVSKKYKVNDRMNKYYILHNIYNYYDILHFATFSHK